MEDKNMKGIDHSKMNHGDKPPMGHAGHNHHAMMIADFKKRIYAVLILSIPILLLSTRLLWHKRMWVF